MLEKIAAGIGLRTIVVPHMRHMGAQWCLIGRSLASLPAVLGQGASLNSGYRSVTRTNA
jgi:hypothetical protein